MFSVYMFHIGQGWCQFRISSDDPIVLFIEIQDQGMYLIIARDFNLFFGRTIRGDRMSDICQQLNLEIVNFVGGWFSWYKLDMERFDWWKKTYRMDPSIDDFIMKLFSCIIRTRSGIGSSISSNRFLLQAEHSSAEVTYNWIQRTIISIRYGASPSTLPRESAPWVIFPIAIWTSGDKMNMPVRYDWIGIIYR